MFLQSGYCLWETVLLLWYRKNQKLRWFCKLPDKLAVFFFEAAFKAAQVTRLWNIGLIQWNGFNEVVTYVHYQVHLDIGYNTKKVYFLMVCNTNKHAI